MPVPSETDEIAKRLSERDIQALRKAWNHQQRLRPRRYHRMCELGIIHIGSGLFTQLGQRLCGELFK